MKPANAADRQSQIFDQKLRSLTKEEASLRPFICEGLPFGCPIFLVGINPSKSAPFWPHWNALNGFNKQGWLADYLAINRRFTPTRQRIEILVGSIAPIRCLETNLFTTLSAREADLSTLERDTTVFDFLLHTVRPRVVFIHGKSGAEHLSRLTGTPIPFQKLSLPDSSLDLYTNVTFNGFTFDVIAGPHLSRGWSYERVRALGKSLAERCQSQS